MKTQRIITLLISILLLISSACQIFPFIPAMATTVPPTSPPESEEAPTEEAIQFGSGPFTFPDTREGLADLSSYKATLTVAFDGTEAGQPQQWSRTYIMLAAKDPAMHELTTEKTGVDAERVFMAEINGVAYERHGKNDCIVTAIEPGNSLTERLEPAGFLSGVIGADLVGSEIVDDVETNYYIFDESAFGQPDDIAQSTGELWVASDGGYIVRYSLTTQGDVDYFGEGLEGTITWEYELTDINVPFTITLPVNCPAGLVNAPTLTDATDTLNTPDLLTYHTSTSLADAAAFYQQEIPNLGWELEGEPTFTDTTVLLDYKQGDQTLTVIITSDATGRTVNVLLGKSQK